MTQNRHRIYTINNWKRYGLVCDDYKKLYEKVMSIDNCELCNVKFDDTIKNQRCMDHDHHTGLYRKTLCRRCNAHYKTASPKIKCNKNINSSHLFITLAKTKNISGNYSFSWRFQRKIDNVMKRKCFKTLTKAIAFSFIQILKNPLQ